MLVSQLLDEAELEKLSAEEIRVLETHLLNHVTKDPDMRKRLREKIEAIKRSRGYGGSSKS